LLKEKPLNMSQLIKNKYFSNEKSFSCILIPEEDDLLKGNWPKFFLNFCLKETFVVYPDFLKNKYVVKGKYPKNVWIFEK
jgi:hypothetical protein